MPLNINTLSTENVLDVHNELVKEFADSSDPIFPPGVKSMELLESAVSRQYTSIDGHYKYPDPISNAATLTYGICNDHAFHNGNKRTALVSMLVHLDKNRFTFTTVTQDEFFNMILGVATHQIVHTGRNKKSTSKDSKPHPDEEVEALTRWIKEKAIPIRRGDKQITYRDLRKILKRFNCELDNPKGNSIDIICIRKLKQRKGFTTETIEVRKKVWNITYRGENAIVPINVIKDVRNVCKLREEDGITSETFYSEGDIINSFINIHRTLLRKLANR